MHTTPRRPRSDDRPTDSPPPRLRRLLAASVLLLIAAGGTIGSITTATAAELSFPFHTDFDTAAGGTLSGDAAIDDGWLRLTSAEFQQAGSWLTDDAFPSDLGLEIEFRYAMYGGTGADGLLMSLSDGAVAPGVGAPGAALGYNCYDETGQYQTCDRPGMPGGFVGLGFDRFGNFTRMLNGSGVGEHSVPNHVVLRGSGNGLSGYRYLDGVEAPSGSLETGSRTGERTVRVTLEPNDQGVLTMTVRSDSGPGTRMRTVLDGIDLEGPGQAALPPTLRLGFAASTGGSTNVHEIDDLTVWTPTNLGITQDMPDPVVAGDRVTYTAVASDSGRNDAIGSAVKIAVPAELDDVHWTCAASDGAACGSAAGDGNSIDTTADIAPGTTVTYTIDGELRPGTTGSIESVATVAPPASRADTDESDNTSTVRAGTRQLAELGTGKELVLPEGEHTVAPGDTFAYRITAENRGPSTATSVGATDDLPDAVAFVDSEDGCSADGRHVTCASDVALAPGETHGFSFRARLDAEYRGDGSDVVNVAVATSPDDEDGADPSDPVRLVVDDGTPSGPSPSPSVTAAPSPSGPGAGGSPSGGSGTGARPGALAFTGAAGTSVLVAIGVVVLVGGVVLLIARRRGRLQDDGALTPEDVGLAAGPGSSAD